MDEDHADHIEAKSLGQRIAGLALQAGEPEHAFVGRFGLAFCYALIAIGRTLPPHDRLDLAAKMRCAAFALEDELEERGTLHMA